MTDTGIVLLAAFGVGILGFVIVALWKKANEPKNLLDSAEEAAKHSDCGDSHKGPLLPPLVKPVCLGCGAAIPYRPLDELDEFCSGGCRDMYELKHAPVVIPIEQKTVEVRVVGKDENGAVILEEADKTPDLSTERMKWLRKRDRCDQPMGSHFFKPENGIAVIRLLPLLTKVSAASSWFVGKKQHYIGGMGKPAVQCTLILQPGKTVEENKWIGDCPICNHWKHLWANVDIADKRGEHKISQEYREKAQKIKGMERYYYNVLVKEESGKWKGPLIWSARKMIHDQIMRYMDEDRALKTGEETYDLLDLQDGYNIKILREQKASYGGFGGWPTYQILPAYAPSAIGDCKEIEAFMANIWDLDAVSRGWHKTHDELTQAMIDAGVAVTIRKCKVCAKRLTTNDPNVIYCSKQCKSKFMTNLIGHRSCPQCGVTDTAHISGIYSYTCGFNGSGVTDVYRRCKHGSACTCKVDKLNEDPRGCKCGAYDAQCESALEAVVMEDDDFLNELRKM
jgi:rubrerythrin